MIGTLQALKTCLWSWNFAPFCSTTIGFRDIVSEKSEMHRMPKTELKHLTVKSTLYTLKTHPWGPHLVRFGLRLFVSAIQHTQSLWKWEMHRMPQIELGHSTVKCSLYTLNTYPRGPNFGPSRSTISSFRDTTSAKIGNTPNDPKLNLNT